VDFDELLYSRRTVRKYEERAIPREVYEELIDAAIQAPSACNRQQWKFIIVDDKALLHRVFEQGGATFIDHISNAILVLYCNRSDNLAYWDHVQSGAAATMVLQLKAYELGIGSCWVCHLPPKRELRRWFGIPGYYDPIALVTLGYFHREPFRRPRKQNLAGLMAYNRFDFADAPLAFFDAALFARKWARRLYYLFPWRKHLYAYARKYEKKFYD
jgi:nitroreductase